MSMPSVDVRNVADAHANALKLDEAQGMRFILNADTTWFTSIAGSLHEEFPTHNVRHAEGGICIFRLAACFDGQAAQIVKYWGMMKTFNNQRSKDVLQIQYIPIDTSLRGMGYSLIKHGLVENKGNLDDGVLDLKIAQF